MTWLIILGAVAIALLIAGGADDARNSQGDER